MLSQHIVEVFEDGHFLRHGIGEKILIDHADASVNDGLLHRLQALLAAYNQLTHGEDEVTFEGQRIFLFGIVQVDVQRIDVVRADRRYPDDLTAELLDKRIILGFRVTDDDVILGDEKGVGHLTLCGEGFTAAGCAENKAVGIFELLAVNHDHVVGQGVQAVIQRLTALKKFLRGKGDEDRSAGSGQCAFNLHLIDADGQRGHQPLFLLEVQPLERTVVLLGDGGRLKDRVLKLLPGGGCVHDENGDKEEAFVPRLEILQQPLCLAAVGGKVGRDNFHIIAGADSLFLFLNLHLVEVGDLHLDALDGLRLVDGADMEVDGDVAVHIEEV